MLEILQARSFKNYSSIFEELKISDEIVSVVEAVDRNEVIGFSYNFV